MKQKKLSRKCLSLALESLHYRYYKIHESLDSCKDSELPLWAQRKLLALSSSIDELTLFVESDINL